MELNRSRVAKGVTTGGQYAPETRSEASGVSLAYQQLELDRAAVAGARELVQDAMNVEIGTWQRRVDRATRGEEWPEMPPQLVDAKHRADNFETLSREDKEALMRQLKLGEAAFLLEPGQQLGTDRIAVAEDLDPRPEDVALGLMAQKQISDADLPGDITLAKIERGVAEFHVEERGIIHKVAIGTGYQRLTAEPEDDEDYTMGEWLSHADISAYGRRITAPGSAASLKQDFEQHQKDAVLLSIVGSSRFSSHGQLFGELDGDARTVELIEGDTSYFLNVAGSKPVLTTQEGTVLHETMARGYLAYVAAKVGDANSDEFAGNWSEIFRQTQRELVR